MHLRLFYLFLFILGGITNMQAQSFEAIPSLRDKLIVGQPFTISYVLKDASGSDFVAPQFKGFQVSGPSSRTEYQNINGVTTRSFSYVFTLIPMEAGNAYVSKASIRVGNKRLQTKAFNFKVAEAASGSQEGAEVIFQIELPKDTFYRGEVIPLEYKLYIPYPYQKNGQRVTIPPQFDGFLYENSNFYYSEDLILDGVRYTSYVVERKYLYPHKSGDLEIPGSTVTVSVGDRRDRYNFFRNNGRNITVRSESKKIKVLPLPNPEPKTFTGGVGEYIFEWEADKNELTTDDVIRLRLKVQGNGDMKNLKAPKLDLQSDSFEVYPAKIIAEDQSEFRDGRLISMRVFEYMISPLKTGTYDVPVDVCYFSPDSMDYLNSPELLLSLNVTQGNGIKFSNTPLSTDTLDEMAQLVEVKLSEATLSKAANKPWIRKWSFWILFILLTGLSIALWMKYRYDENFGEINKQKSAQSNALKNLRQGTELMNEAIPAHFKQINLLIYTFISDRFAKGKDTNSIQSVISILKDQQIDSSLIEQLEKILKDNELYTYGMPLPGEFQTYKDELIKILENIDR